MNKNGETTNYPFGVTSYGIPMVGSGQLPITNGTYWFVDGVNGNDGAEGTSLSAAFKTIGAAAARVGVNDVIAVLPGTYSEVVTLTVAGVSIIGLGNLKTIQWTSATDTKTLTLAGNYQSVSGIYFKAPTFTAGIPASIALNGANYASISGNRFQGQTGSWNAIYSAAANSDNVSIVSNDFEYFNTASHGAAILCIETGGLSYSDWQIRRNKFTSCITNVSLNGRVCLIEGNHFAVAGISAAGSVSTSLTTTSLNLQGATGTSSGANQVHGNYFAGTYSIAGGYTAGVSGDDWAGNFKVSGVTAALPA